MSEALELVYDPFGLPTAQHRAGLAGLLVLLDTMRRRGLPNVADAEINGAGCVRLTLTEATLAGLFNDLYDATEAVPEGKGNKPKRRKGRSSTGSAAPGEEIQSATDTASDGEDRRITPKGLFLQALGMPEVWLKLWRETNVFRVKPRARTPYHERASSKDVGLSAHVWDDLARWKEAAEKGRHRTGDFSSSVFIGAEETNAEQVKFLGGPDENLLLHFWPVVMGIGEAWATKREGDELDDKPVGYVIAVPDVADLEWFLEVYPKKVASLDPAKFKWRPRDAVLAIPEEGGLEYLSDIMAVMAAREEREEIGPAVVGVEVYYLVRKGRDVRIRATGRVPARQQLVTQYERIRGRYYDLLFRGQLIRNLLQGLAWYDGFDRVFATRERDLFIGQRAGGFAADAGRKFQVESQEMGAMNDTGRDTFDVSKCVHDMVRQYVYLKTDAKAGAGVKWKDFKDRCITDPKTGKERVDVPPRYRDAREKVCQDAFLAMRACRARQDFVAYYTGTICAVPQYLPATEYRALSAVLLADGEGWEHVKALSMLTLSALAQV